MTRYTKRVPDFIDDIDESLRNLDYLNDEESFEKEQQLKAMRICAYAIIRLAERYPKKQWKSGGGNRRRKKTGAFKNR